MDRTKATRRDRRDTSSGVYDLFILALTVFSLGMMAAYYLSSLTEATRDALLTIDVPISLIFSSSLGIVSFPSTLPYAIMSQETWA
jgi:hypothetical protein